MFIVLHNTFLSMDILKIKRETFKDAVQSLLHEDSSYIMMTEKDGNLKLSSTNTENYAAGNAIVKIDDSYPYQPIQEMYITGKYIFDGFILSKFLDMSPYINSPELEIKADSNLLEFINGNHSIKLINVKANRKDFNTDNLFSQLIYNIRVEVSTFKEYVDFIARYSNSVIFSIVDNTLYLTSDDMQDDGGQGARVKFLVGDIECSECQQSKYDSQAVNWFIRKLPNHVQYINVYFSPDFPICLEYTTNHDLMTVRYFIAPRISQ